MVAIDNERLVKVFDKQADKWDRRRRKQTLDSKWRRQLLAGARGQVLEIAVGAGGNFAYYDRSVHVTALDFSPLMVEKAKGAAKENRIEADFFVGDIAAADFPEGAYDTVVSTLSMCAYSDPVWVLEQMNRWCREDGQILLLEHGKSAFTPLAWLQNLVDPLQVRMVGCHANRDIEGILNASPLKVERHERHFFGMVDMVWARSSR